MRGVKNWKCRSEGADSRERVMHGPPRPSLLLIGGCALSQSSHPNILPYFYKQPWDALIPNNSNDCRLCTLCHFFPVLLHLHFSQTCWSHKQTRWWVVDRIVFSILTKNQNLCSCFTALCCSPAVLQKKKLECISVSCRSYSTDTDNRGNFFHCGNTKKLLWFNDLKCTKAVKTSRPLSWPISNLLCSKLNLDSWLKKLLMSSRFPLFTSVY